MAVSLLLGSRRRVDPCTAPQRAKDKLSALVEDAETTHDIITITKHGRSAAVLMSADDLESLQETLYWLSQPNIRDDIVEGEREYAEGSTIDGDALREEFGLPPR